MSQSNYKVGDKEFDTFEEVVDHAWNESKYDLYEEADLMSELDRKIACQELAILLIIANS